MMATTRSMFKNETVKNRVDANITDPNDKKSKLQNTENTVDTRSTTISRKRKINILKPPNPGTEESIDTGGMRLGHPDEVTNEITREYVQVDDSDNQIEPMDADSCDVHEIE